MLKVLKSGFYASIQDLGRFGFRSFGVPVSGSMDAYSSQFANALLGNGTFDAVIEMTMVGGTFQFMEPTVIAISGADMRPTLNSEAIVQNGIITIKAKDILSFGKHTRGFRTYLAIKGGFTTETVLGSKSQYHPVTANNTLQKNDTLSYEPFSEAPKKSNATVKYDDSVLLDNVLEAYKGPEFEKLSDIDKHVLLNTEFKVSKLNNRMAYQLEPLIKNDLKPILTSPVLPGTVQWTPQGNLIVLMRDGQSTGGYPRVLQFSEMAINTLSQKTVGNTLKIRLKDQ